MADRFAEMVISSPFILVKGFLLGWIHGRDDRPVYYFSRRSGIKTETLAEHLKDWLGLENYVHLCLECDYVQSFKDAVSATQEKLGMEIISCKEIRSAYFEFNANLHDKEAVTAFQKELDALDDVETEYTLHETDLVSQGWDMGPGGFSAIPFHRFIISGKIAGGFEAVLRIFRDLKANPMVEMSEVILVFPDDEETVFTC
ncbi:MAG: hypothetical protein JXQ27_04405 [Acidobacteria bacterium]|nr:hypothetical protein [Acidobacteriota bacterium]